MSASAAEPTNETVQLADQRQTVAQVTYSLVAGGSETYAFTVAAHLPEERFRSIIIALDRGGALEPEVRQRGIPYFVLDRPYRVDWRTMLRVYRLLRQHDAKVVHTHHLAQLTHAVLGAKLVGARIIHVEHSVSHYQHRRLRWLLRFLVPFCHRVVAIGDDVARVLHERIGIPEKKLEIIRAGIDVDKYNCDRMASRRDLGLETVALVAVNIARLAPEKNHGVLLDAFASTCTAMPNAKLLVVGDGPEEQAIRDRIEELGLSANVQLLGVRRDVPRLLAAADVFVLSSDREGLPIAALEAMAAGRPVVATAVGDLPRVVKNGHNGYVVPPGDVNALAEAMRRVLSNPNEAAKMGLRGRAMVERDYGLDGMIARHEALYVS